MDLRPHFAIKTIEVLKQKRLRQLPRPICTKIKKQNGVAITDALFICVRKNQRRHELIGFTIFILPTHSGRGGRLTNFAASENDRIPSLFRAVPTPIAIHREVSSYDGDDPPAALLKILLALFQKPSPASGRRIPPIRERVNQNLRNA